MVELYVLGVIRPYVVRWWDGIVGAVKLGGKVGPVL